jgi:acetolactate synthase-1/3 small subunit
MNGKDQAELRHTLSILVDNEPGVLTRVAGLFSGRNFNISSLSVAETTDPKISRITIVVPGNEMILEQIQKQLRKLINVHKVIDLTDQRRVERELALVRVRAQNGDRAEILRIVDIFRGKIVDVGPTDYIVEVTGDEDKVEAFLELLSRFGITELAKSGVTALPRTKQGERK